MYKSERDEPDIDEEDDELSLLCPETSSELRRMRLPSLGVDANFIATVELFRNAKRHHNSIGGPSSALLILVIKLGFL